MACRTSSAAAAFFLLVIPLADASAQLNTATESEEAKRAVAQVLPLWSSQFVSKWAISPKISCVGEAVAHKETVQQFITEVNAILEGLLTLTLAADNQADADIFFAVDSTQNLATYRKQQHLTAGTYEVFCTTNLDKSLKRFWVFLDNQRLTRVGTPNHKAEIYRCLLNALGYSHGLSRGKITDSPALSTEMERKMLRFQYELVPSGSSKAEVGKLVRANWDLLRVPAAPVVVAPIAAPVDRLQGQQALEAFIPAVLTNHGASAFRKWTRSPRVSCLGQAVGGRKYVEDFCEDVRDALEGLPVQPFVGPDNDKTADITVIKVGTTDQAWATVLYKMHPIDPRKEPLYVKNTETPYREAWPSFPNHLATDRWQMRVWQNPSSMPDGTVGTKPMDKDDSLRRYTQIGGLEAFGLWLPQMNPPNPRMDSVLCPGSPKRLTEFDKKLIRFAYEFVPLGASKEAIIKLVQTKWQ